MGHIRLYIAGSTPNSMRAQQNLRAALDAWPVQPAPIDIELIDVFQHPKQAILEGILVTPTLVAIAADKRLTMVGDLTDAVALRSILETLQVSA